MVRSELRTKIGEGEETVGVIETLLILAVTAFHFAIVSWRIGADQFVANPEACSRLLKKSWQVFFAVGETVGKLKAIVSLNALYPNAPAFEPDDHFFEEIRRRIGTLLRIGSQITQSGIFVYCRILV